PKKQLSPGPKPPAPPPTPASTPRSPHPQAGSEPKRHSLRGSSFATSGHGSKHISAGYDGTPKPTDPVRARDPRKGPHALSDRSSARASERRTGAPRQGPRPTADIGPAVSGRAPLRAAR